jgi:hypothetical protein
MYKITDVLSLGEDYTVSDSEGNVLSKIQVIPLTELMSASLGPYTEDFGSYESYLEKSLASFTGLDEIDPTRVLWYATTEDEVALSDLIEYATKHGYDRIILEHLDELE